MKQSGATKAAVDQAPAADRAGLIVRIGVIMLAAGMILCIAGILAAPLFLPGTWVLLLALLVIAAGSLLRGLRPATGE